jgi:TRAP-type C4-dicarboxylate transport system permease small subunit
MKLCNKISKGVAKGAEVICMLTIAALVLVIVVELLRRNFLVQLCGILFLWMAFIGLIPLYRDSGLMRLDFLVARTKGPVYEVLYFANKLFSLLLGVVMVVAFAAQYPYVSTRTYSTFPIPVPYTVQYFPMCLAGAYMALESLRQMAEHVAEKARGSRAQV